MYETQADSIDVDILSTNSNNRIVLRRLQINEASQNTDSLFILNEHVVFASTYCPEGAYDMGWLGYFIGKSEHLKELHIEPFTSSAASVRDFMEPFLRGASRNKSIREINFNGAELLGGEMFTMLGSFFRNNHNLTEINISACEFGDEGVRLFALAIGSSTHSSLKDLCLRNNNIAEEGMAEIITALSAHPKLECVDFRENHLQKNGCVALSNLLQVSATKLKSLYLSTTQINDEGVEALVPALANCSHLKNLDIMNNPSITTGGWQSFATILEAPKSNLKHLYIARNNVDDEVVATFASLLTSNHKLQVLDMNNNPSITAVGWEALPTLLCDPSSVNATFLSNHALQYIAEDTNTNANAILEPLLGLNARNDKKEVATIKILQSHDDFDMLPFFEWEFKVLPLILGWLERASAYRMPRGFEPNVDERKLSTIYQFVRGMPVLYVETRLRKELEDIKEEQRMLEERKMNIMRRLGRL